MNYVRPYEVIEDNGGGITLFVYDDGKVVYAHSGYEALLPSEDLRQDIASLLDGDDPTKWDGCYGDSPDEKLSLEEYRKGFNSDDERNGGWRLIADNGGMYYDRMGAAGHSIFGEGGVE